MLLVGGRLHSGLAHARATPAALEPAGWPRGTRWRARVQYDGEQFKGSQVQPSGRTVAGVLERALSTRFSTPIRVMLASRTDAGVHARNQAVHFDIPFSDKPPCTPHKLQLAMNSLLPDDVRILEMEPAPELDDIGRPWHAIRWATGKLCAHHTKI